MKLSGKLVGLALAGTMVIASTTVQAGGSHKSGVGGTIACSGNHFNRLGGSEAHRTSWTLRNFSDTPVRIEQMTLFDANGNTLFTADGASLPAFRNNVLGTGDNVIDPNQTAQILSQDLIGDGGLGRNARPVTMKFTWASDTKTKAPSIGSTRFVRERTSTFDPVTGAVTTSLGKERSRHSSSCDTVSLVKERDDD